MSIARVLIAAGFTVALVGCGSDDPVTERLVGLDADEFSFTATEAITVRAGDTIRFDVRNVGNLAHEMEVLTEASRSLGRTERIQPGQTRSTTVTFAEAGVYTVICDIDDHRSRGQQARITVEP